MEQNNLNFTSNNLQIPRVKLLLYYSKKNSVREVSVDGRLVLIDSLNQVPESSEIHELVNQDVRF